MRVKRVSLVFHRALNSAGITPHIAPAASAATNMSSSSAQSGQATRPLVYLPPR